MTIYKMKIAENDHSELTIHLEQLGAVTKPWYYCQMRHKGKGPMDKSQPIDFFLEQFADPTKAVEAVVSLSRGLSMHFLKSRNLEETRSYALDLHEVISNSKDWTKTLATCLAVEMQEMVGSA